MDARRLSILSVIFAFAYGHAANRNVLTAELNMMRGGDVLERVAAAPFPAGDSGEDVFWNFSEISETGKSVRRHVSAGDTVFAVIEGGTMDKYRFSGDSIISIGYENRLAVLNDSVPYTRLVFPFSYGQKTGGSFIFTGRYAQDRDAETGGTVTVEADATGRMLLPSLDTLDNVLRVRTDTRAWLRLLRHGEALDDSIATDSLPFYERSVYEWYAPGYRYPVFETRLYRLYEHGRPCGSYGVSYYYPTAEQESLANDPANRKIREDIFLEKRGLRADGDSERNSDGENGQDGGRGTVSGVVASATPSEVTVSFDVSGGETVIGMTLADLYGRVYGYIPEHAVGEGSHTETIDTSRLTPGEYVLTVFANGAKLDEIILNH